MVPCRFHGAEAGRNQIHEGLLVGDKVWLSLLFVDCSVGRTVQRAASRSVDAACFQ